MPGFFFLLSESGLFYDDVLDFRISGDTKGHPDPIKNDREAYKIGLSPVLMLVLVMFLALSARAFLRRIT